MKESISTRISPNSDIYPEHSAQSPKPTRVLYTLTTPLREPPERWRLAHAGCSGPAYDGLTPC